ncbi:hypothetical protein GH714_021524 [Hevea brasiliensis]|uniref:DUF7876 domain-containing protein n=1 Tax=Hevea brasiliensis TaxID=3981 RepID=A0A6A6LTC8_HEVBR|nr:hypothetical protein GH714_021524 [Hevea brasiliensis]
MSLSVKEELINAGVNAYALGCTDEGLWKELNAMKESGVEIEALQNNGGSTSVKSKIFAKEASCDDSSARNAVIGRAEEPSIVASRMRLVFSTLEVRKFLSLYD